jgi:hypothetical protein
MRVNQLNESEEVQGPRCSVETFPHEPCAPPLPGPLLHFAEERETNSRKVCSRSLRFRIFSTNQVQGPKSSIAECGMAFTPALSHPMGEGDPVSHLPGVYRLLTQSSVG